jgi:uncharacterized protein YbcI
MLDPRPTIAQQVAQAARVSQVKRTGHPPVSVDVAISDKLLIITLHGALTPAERALSTSHEGSAAVQEFHRLLFAASSSELQNEINRITGIEVQDSGPVTRGSTGAMFQSFADGTMVQLFLLKEGLTEKVWNSH